ncbi:unnamed protein product [Rotaria magnacalcarata]|uniref:Uncharacterized protein n=1 Tax=Rotaria magnacalcarata TaxID=392030 RepID=A0A819SJS2_9BILA|nr:unnamed protein product [Rotaria magnacalcarata]
MAPLDAAAAPAEEVGVWKDPVNGADGRWWWWWWNIGGCWSRRDDIIGAKTPRMAEAKDFSNILCGFNFFIFLADNLRL